METRTKPLRLVVLLKGIIILVFFLLLRRDAFAHQTPSTIMLLDVNPQSVAMELQLPLSELELAFGHDVFTNSDNLVQRLEPQLREYLLAHIHVTGIKDKPWVVEVTDMRVEKAEQPASGPPFKEMTVHLRLTPYAGAGTRKFILDYTVIMHQVINHAAFVSVRNDWETGKADGHTAEAGVIHWDLKDNRIYPLEINLEKGSWGKGFKSMVGLGMQHIKEGTDHLLFLLVLLLPCMLLLNGKTWGRFGGVKYSVIRLLKIVTAFTIGHSCTLLIGALGLLHLPSQPVEILIAFSILISAIHAIYPIFPGREVYIAAGFGLIHGLAFASVLTNLHLGAGPMALSILGFNLGIECMQLLVVIIIMPWLVILSQTGWYSYIRVVGSILAGIAALAWIAERSSGNANAVSNFVLKLSQYALWNVIALAILSLMIYFLDKKKRLFTTRVAS